MNLILTGDQNNLPQELTDAQVNHLRRLLAWLVCEYNLSDEGQRGIMEGLHKAVSSIAFSGQARPIFSGSSDHLEWVIGADGKARRVKPGIRLLAHGVPSRVAKLRALGNAIDLRPAVAFIRATM